MNSDGVNVPRVAYTVRETAQALGLSTKSVYQAIQRGEITSVKVGGRLLVPVANLEALGKS